MPYNGDGTFSLVQDFGTGTPSDTAFPNKVGSDLTDIATSIGKASLTTLLSTNGYLLATNNLSDVASVSAARTNLGIAVEFISGMIAVPAAQDYRLIESIPFGVTVTGFVGKLTSGTMAATLKVGTVAMTNGVLAATSTQATVSPSANNVLVANNTLVLTAATLASPSSFTFVVSYSRT